VLLESKRRPEVGAQPTLRVPVDLLPRRAVFEHALERNVVALLPGRARVVHVAVGREPVRVALEL
jgi:hypothetical protein